MTATTPDAPKDIHADCPAFPLLTEPVQSEAWPRWHELGHWAALLLAVIGLDKRTWRWIKARLGLVPECGCDQREAAMNTLGSRFAAGIKRFSKTIQTLCYHLWRRI